MTWAILNATFHDKLFKTSSHTFFLKVLSEGVNFRSKESKFLTFAPRKARPLASRKPTVWQVGITVINRSKLSIVNL